jgi:hypothetical protein
VAAAALAGCAPPGPPPSVALSPSQIEEPVTAAVAAALEADARREAADSLWDPEATVIANGELRDGPPRFAGLGIGGQVAMTTSRLDLRQWVAWMYLEYRWADLPAGVVREGRATILLSPGPDGRWRIVHAHSSTVPE